MGEFGSGGGRNSGAGNNNSSSSSSNCAGGGSSRGGRMEKWVCPNDRQLALRAKLGTGWSVHTNRMATFNRGENLTLEEQEHIMQVINKAEFLDQSEQERIGRLVEKLENMKKNAIGNGSNQCILCGDEFGLLAGASPTYCDDCKKAVCSKCGVDTHNCHKQPLWLCKICAEQREVWKRSGAWFFKGLPKYTLPEKAKYEGGGKRSSSVRGPQVRGSFRARPGSVRDSNYTWHRARGGSSTGTGSYGESSEHDTSESSDEDISLAKHKSRKGHESESDSVSVGSARGGSHYDHYSGRDRDARADRKSSVTSGSYGGERERERGGGGAPHHSATDYGRGDDPHDVSDSERHSGGGGYRSGYSRRFNPNQYSPE